MKKRTRFKEEADFGGEWKERSELGKMTDSNESREIEKWREMEKSQSRRKCVVGSQESFGQASMLYKNASGLRDARCACREVTC